MAFQVGFWVREWIKTGRAWENGSESRRVSQQGKRGTDPGTSDPPVLIALVIQWSQPLVLGINLGHVPLDLGLGVDVIILATALRVVSKELDGVRTNSLSCSVHWEAETRVCWRAGKERRNMDYALLPIPGCWVPPHYLSPTPAQMQGVLTPTMPAAYPTMHMVFSELRTLLPVTLIRKRNVNVSWSDFWRSLLPHVSRKFNLSELQFLHL